MPITQSGQPPFFGYVNPNDALYEQQQRAQSLLGLQQAGRAGDIANRGAENEMLNADPQTQLAVKSQGQQQSLSNEEHARQGRIQDFMQTFPALLSLLGLRK